MCVVYPQMSVPSLRSAAISLDYTSPGCYLATSRVLGSLEPILQGIEYGLLLLFSEHPKVGLCLNENFGITTAYNQQQQRFSSFQNCACFIHLDTHRPRRSPRPVSSLPSSRWDAWTQKGLYGELCRYSNCGILVASLYFILFYFIACVRECKCECTVPELGLLWVILFSFSFFSSFGNIFLSLLRRVVHLSEHGKEYTSVCLIISKKEPSQFLQQFKN